MTLDLPRVTVCVPVRNGARTISRTLDSILAQDYPNYEIIVSDNCSTDETANIVQCYSARGIRYYLNPQLEPYGESNWNHILSLAKAPLIALYHADDIYTPTIVRRQVEFLEAHPETSAVFTMSQAIDEQDRPIRMGCFRLPKELRSRARFEFPEFFNATLKYSTFVPVPTMMTRRSVLDTVGVFHWQMYASASDIDLYLRMARQWGPIGVIDEPLHKYRISDQQGSAQLFYQRTFLAHFCNVLDDYISMPESVGMIHKSSLSLYRMRRATDQIRCAINMLVQNRVAEAKTILIHAIKYKYIMAALKVVTLKRPQEVALFLVGSILLASSYLSVGAFSGRQIYKIFQRYSKGQQKPLG